MRLGRIVAALALALAPSAAATGCWERASYAFPSAVPVDVRVADSGFLARDRAVSAKLDPLLLGILADRGAELIVTTQAPAQVPEFARFAYQSSPNPGRIMNVESAFVVSPPDHGYYDPARVAKGTGALNAFLHETGHLFDWAYGPRGFDTGSAFEAASRPYLAAWAKQYVEPGRSWDETLTLARREIFAESFDRYFDSVNSRYALRYTWPALAAYWDTVSNELPSWYEATTHRDLTEICRIDELLRPLRVQAPPSSHVR